MPKKDLGRWVIDIVRKTCNRQSKMSKIVIKSYEEHPLLMVPHNILKDSIRETKVNGKRVEVLNLIVTQKKNWN